MDIVLEQPTHTPSTRVTARTQPQSDVDGAIAVFPGIHVVPAPEGLLNGVRCYRDPAPARLLAQLLPVLACLSVSFLLNLLVSNLPS